MPGYDYRKGARRRENQAQAVLEARREAQHQMRRADALERRTAALLKDLRRMIPPGSPAARVLAAYGGDAVGADPKSPAEVLEAELRAWDAQRGIRPAVVM